MHIGTKVKKLNWYRYPWVIVSIFQNTKWETRYVVEATWEDYNGMLHIFNSEQLAPLA